jgi:enoyl-CoA hydratase/carnithine racemase
MSVISVEQQGAVTIVKIDRPPANAMSPELLEEGAAVVEKLREDPPAAVVLTGIPGYFSAGLDLKIAPTLDADGQRAMVTGINRIFTAWYTAPFPTVAAVTGHAIAGGMILALCCDYRIVGQAGKFGLTEVKVGAPYPAAALAVVQAELTKPAARRLALRAHLIDADTAFNDGAFDEQVNDDQVVARAIERAEEFAQLPARAYTQTKLAMRSATITALEQIAADGDPLSQEWLGDETADAAARTLAG